MPDVLTGDLYARLSYNPFGVRESTERQISDGLAVAARQQIHIPAERIWVDDSLSAWRRNVRRPGWETLLDRISAGLCDVLVIWHLDRLFRQPRDLERLIDAADNGLRVISCIGSEYNLNNADSRFIMRVLVAQACKSSDDTSRRVAHWAAAAAQKGRVPGGSRHYGYGVTVAVDEDTNRPIIDKSRINEDEAVIVREIAERVIAGEPAMCIAEDLNARAVPTLKDGTVWSQTRVRQLISSPTLAGLRSHHGQVVAPGRWEAILDADTWRKAKAAVAARSQPRTTRTPDVYLLSGLVVCGRCGTKLVTLPKFTSKKTGKVQAARYTCSPRSPRRPGCGKLVVTAARIDEVAEQHLEQLADDPAAWPVPADIDRDKVETELRAVSQELVELARRYADRRGGRRAMSADEYDALRDGLAARRDELEASLSARPTDLADITSGRQWADMDPWQRRAFARAALSAVTVAPAARKGPPFDPSRVSLDWR